ncbi:MAG: hypothetical protein KDD47_22960 [Acidobacteria bacterium]|nr:hypothetical protein [Acidobacteriota bacterium]
MKLWMLFVLGAFLAWGCYVPMIHAGQVALKGSPLRAFLCVGLAYFLTAVLVPLGMLAGGMEEGLSFNLRGVQLSFVAGVLGAAGALCVILALKSGGTPLVVTPLVFAGAPVVNALVSMGWYKPKSAPEVWFYVGLALAALGAFLVLRFRPT